MLERTQYALGYQPLSTQIYPLSLPTPPLPPPSLNLQIVQAPLLGNSPLHIGFSQTASLKTRFFSEPL